VVDEDLTDLTAGELVAAVANYLAHQEALDVRLRHVPAMDDPRWGQIQAGPDGVLYDLGAMLRLVQKLIEGLGAQKSLAPPWWWSRVHLSEGADPQMAPLRLFCRLRGIELPYRNEHIVGRRSAGLAQALERTVADVRPDHVVVLSDLAGVLDDEARVSKAFARVRRRASSLTVVVPATPEFAAVGQTPVGKTVAIMTHDHRRELSAALARPPRRAGGDRDPERHPRKPAGPPPPRRVSAVPARRISRYHPRVATIDDLVKARPQIHFLLGLEVPTATVAA
jgi:hypothetical protein